MKRYQLMYFEYEGIGCLEVSPFDKLQDKETIDVYIASEVDATILELRAQVKQLRDALTKARPLVHLAFARNPAQAVHGQTLVEIDMALQGAGGGNER